MLILLQGGCRQEGTKTKPEGGELPSFEITGVFEPEGESNVRCSFALNKEEALIGTEETADVYWSKDQGKTWEKVFDAGEAYDAADVRRILRADDGNLYASTSGQGDILRSTDEGKTWERINSIPAWRTVGIEQLDNGVFLIGARKDESGKTSIYRSTDYCQTLNHIPIDTPEQQNVTTFEDLGDGRVLAGIGFDGSGKVFLSEDHGQSWRQTADFKGTKDLLDFIVFEGTLFASTKSEATLYKSDDGGETWEKAYQVWDKGFLGTFDLLETNGQSIPLLSGTDQRNAEIFHHYIIASLNQGKTWKPWILLHSDVTGGASNLTVLNKEVILAGTGNHSAQGRLHTIRLHHP